MHLRVIDWEEYKKELEVLTKEQKLDFAKYMSGDYIRSQGFSPSTHGLNDFLQSLTQQELDLFLKVKGKATRDYIVGKTFTEIILHCIDRTGAQAKRPLLYALRFIVLNSDYAKNFVIENTQVLEKIANAFKEDNKAIAIDILNIINKPYQISAKPQYFFKPNSEYVFSQQLKDIISRTKKKLSIWDNYIDIDILKYIELYVKDKQNLSEIRIISNRRKNKNNTDKLNFELNKFQKQYTHIKVESKSSNESHDRFLIVDSEVWHLGPSLKDGGNKACVINQLKDKAFEEFIEFFEQEWSKKQNNKA